MNKIKNVTSKIISNFWATLIHLNFDYTFKNGQTVNMTNEVFGRSDGVAVLLYNEENQKILLTKQFRAPVYVAGIDQGFSIEIVGGAIDKNETPIEATKRESQEEVGVEVYDLEKVTTVFLSPGLLKERVHLFIGKYKSDQDLVQNKGVFSENEEIEVMELSIAEVKVMIEQETIKDARTILLTQHLILNLNK